MIIDILLNLLYAFIFIVISPFTLLSDVQPNNDLTTSIVTFVSYFSSLYFIVPFATIFGIIAFELAFETLYFGYKLIRWAYRKIPGVT